MHRQLADVWLAVDRDPRRASRASSGAPARRSRPAGASSSSSELTNDYAARTRVMREARDIVFNVINCSKPIVSAIHGPAVGAGLVVALLADVSVAATVGEDHRRPHPARRRGRRPRRHLLAAAVRHGQGQVLPPHLRDAVRRGGRAHRAGVAVRRRRPGPGAALEVARTLAGGAQSALRWTKHTLNNWYRMMGPVFDASLALEFYGFGGPDAAEGLASHREKRALPDRSARPDRPNQPSPTIEQERRWSMQR